jgi:hypothetical protein
MTSTDLATATLPDRRGSSAIARILDRVEIVGPLGCWIYPTLNDSGYGVIGVGGRGGPTMRTHRVAYEHMVGPIPKGMDLDHVCRVRACCNPAHVVPVTRGENLARGVKKTLQTHCKQGHEMTGANVKHTKRQRICLECARRASREYQARKRTKGESA